MADYAFYSLAWDEEIIVGFTRMKLSGFRVMRELNSPSGSGLVAPDTLGNKYLTASGVITNHTGTSVKRAALAVKIIVDNKYTYTGNVMIDYNGSLVSELPAAASGKLYLYAGVPDSAARSFQEGAVLFGFDHQFGSNPGSPETADFRFGLMVDAAMADRARQEPPREKAYYEESPSLSRSHQLYRCKGGLASLGSV